MYYLLTKPTVFCRQAVTLTRLVLGPENVRVAISGEDEPGGAADRFTGIGPDDTIISYLSPWIVPAIALARAGAAINFHPGTTDYPGFASYSFAIFEEAGEFGAICHHMTPEIDAGPIIAERRFPMGRAETVEGLKFRTMVTMLGLYHEVLVGLAARKVLPEANLRWSRKATTSRDMHALARITPQMPPDEIERRVRAMSYPGTPGPYTEIGGMRFHLTPPQRQPIA